MREQQISARQRRKPRPRLDVANRFDLAAQGLTHQLGTRVAVPLHVPAISPVGAKGTGDRPVADDDISPLVGLLAGLRGFVGRALVQPGVVFDPQLVHGLAGNEPRSAVHPERKPAAAVGFHVLRDRVRAVALGEEAEEIAAVEIIPVERKAAPFGIDFGERAQTSRAFRAHHPLEMALSQPPVALVPVGLGIDRETFDHPIGLEQIWKPARKERRERERHNEIAAEDPPQSARRAPRLVEVNDVREFVREHELQPLAVLQQLAFVGGGQDDPDEVERVRRGVPVRKVERVQHHDLGTRLGLPVEPAGDAGIDGLGDLRHRPGLRKGALGEMHREVRGVERAPAERGIHELRLRPQAPREQHRRPGVQ